MRRKFCMEIVNIRRDCNRLRVLTKCWFNTFICKNAWGVQHALPSMLMSTPILFPPFDWTDELQHLRHPLAHPCVVVMEDTVDSSLLPPLYMWMQRAGITPTVFDGSAFCDQQSKTDMQTKIREMFRFRSSAALIHCRSFSDFDFDLNVTHWFVSTKFIKLDLLLYGRNDVFRNGLFQTIGFPRHLENHLDDWIDKVRKGQYPTAHYFVAAQEPKHALLNRIQTKLSLVKEKDCTGWKYSCSTNDVY